MTEFQQDNTTDIENIEEPITITNSNSMDEESLNQIKETFLLFDQDNDGYITKQELSTLLRALGKNLTDLEINNLITKGLCFNLSPCFYDIPPQSN